MPKAVPVLGGGEAHARRCISLPQTVVPVTFRTTSFASTTFGFLASSTATFILPFQTSDCKARGCQYGQRKETVARLKRQEQCCRRRKRKPGRAAAAGIVPPSRPATIPVRPSVDPPYSTSLAAQELPELRARTCIFSPLGSAPSVRWLGLLISAVTSTGGSSIVRSRALAAAFMVVSVGW